ncbi:MAG: amino acid ABC transporter permease [Erysipelotrichaceae bacterium]|nr:amino acid ABC transporter permease [Erysipelotrichaceae bacterium]
MHLLSLMAQPGSNSTLIDWMIFLVNKYQGLFISGTINTLYVAVIGTLLGFLLGAIIGIISDTQTSKEDTALKLMIVRFLKFISAVFVEIFRGTPMIVQAMIIYYGLLQAGVHITSVVAGVLVVVLNTGAYMAETVRAGIKSIDVGQREGASALGMSGIQTMTSIILPQAIKNIMPEMSNLFLTNLKMTSVLNVIGVSELFLMAKTAGGTYYKYFESYLVIAVIYFVLCFVFNRVFQYVEHRMADKENYVLAAEFMESE